MRSLVVFCLIVASSYALHLGKNVIDPTLNWRVVGGTNAPDGKYPHQVSIRWHGFHSCGGSIVDKEWVITAAHCVSGENPDNLQVVAGSNTLDPEGTVYQVRKIYRHEDFNGGSGQNDVAIMKVDTIEFNEKVNKIAVETKDIPGDVPVILSGWGTTSVGGDLPNDLQHINLKSTSVKQCQDAYANTDRPIKETQICTLTIVGEGACHGDSGGPLITDVKGDRKLVGIVSWGTPCARGHPDVFGRVSSYVDWFNKQCKNCLSV